MTRDIEKEADEYYTDVYKQCFEVCWSPADAELCKEYVVSSFLAGAKAERKWWAERWREYQTLKPICRSEPNRRRVMALIDEMSQAAGEVD